MPTTLTVADFLSLRMQYKAEQAENEIPAVILKVANCQV